MDPRGKTTTMNMTRKYKSVALAIAGVILLPSCATTSRASSQAQSEQDYHVKTVQHGKASWYSVKTNYGSRTASGERLTNTGYTAAHKTLPMGTKVRVTNESNGKSEVLTINDRGPFVKGRIIDVTIGSAERLGFAGRGVAPVKVEVLGKVKSDDNKVE